ncbi:MAG: DNA replication and repair protein RecF [Cyclobacteriaceae bacterium]
MILKSLKLTHFKNHVNATFNFNDGINCVVGKNGTGKTNLLDAIYYLSFTKSALGSSDRLVINHEKDAFTIFGNYDDFTEALQFEKGKAKIIKVDGKEPEKLRDMIGRVPLVIVLPDDTSMIKEGSEERRKFFDGALCQFNQEYLEMLLGYNRLLKQRNSLLKQNDGKSVDYKLIETYDDQLIPFSKEISACRSEIVSSFLPFLEKNYKDLHDGRETPGLAFKTQVSDDFEEIFKANFPKDQVMQRTMLGCHKDDFEFTLDSQAIKKFGSQGQQKTFIISLKLALYDFLADKTDKKPILLLDDIFDKLDDSRIELLVALLLDQKRFGQIFITDARKDRSKELFNTDKEVNFIELTT